MIWRIFCILLVMSSVALGATHTITSLPYTFGPEDMTIGQTDTLVIAGTKLTSATNGIMLSSSTSAALHDVVLNLGTDTVVFGTGGGDSNYGVRTSGPTSRRPYKIKVVGGTVLHQPSDTSANHNRCLVVGSIATTFENVKATVRGLNGQVMYGGDVYGLRVIGGTYTSYVTGFDSRCNYDAPVVKLDNLTTYANVSALPGDTLHVMIDGLTIDNGPHMGIAIMGRDWADGNLGYAEIKNCNIRTDGRNDMYLSYDGLCHSASNPYALSLKNVGPGTSAHHNTITSGTNYAGCRGILVERGRGTVSNAVKIYKNTVDIHEGPDVEYPTAPVHALRIRFGPLHIDVDSNTFIATADNNTSTTSMNDNINMIRISNEGNGIEQADVRLRNNRIEARSLSASGVTISAVNFDQIEVAASSTFENNYIASSGTIYEIGGYNGEAPGNVIIGDTVSFLSPQLSPKTWVVGYLSLNYDCSGNIARDVTYLGGTSDKDIHFANDGICDLKLQRTMKVNVIGNNGLTVSGAQVTVTNGYNQTVLSGLTSNGVLSGPVTYWYESRGGADSVSFGTFRVKVKKGSDSTMFDHVVSAISLLPVLTLLNTAGEGTQIDTTPPATINDLEASVGSQQGQVILGWTAPGDDDNTGAAASYVVKYATSEITDATWNSAGTAPNPGFPETAGTTETYALSGLTPGEHYFFAVRAYDEEQNSSAVSNSPASFATGIKVPQPTATTTDEDNQSVTVTAATVQSYLTVNYEFALDSVISFPNPEVSTSLASGGTPTATFDGLQSDVTYFWRCRAVEAGGSMSSAWSTPVGFDLANGSVNLLADGDLIAPENGEAVASIQPTLQVAEVDGVQYVYFQVDDNNQFSSPLESGAIQATSDNPTSWQVAPALAAEETFYWRASSDNLNWTASRSFTTPANSGTSVAEEPVFAYPNPMNAANGESEVTFANLAVDSRLTIISVSGSFVMKDREVGPGDWIWNGQNESGGEVGSGVYLYYVNAPTKTAKGKIVVIR
jgi:hypothetical protein